MEDNKTGFFFVRGVLEDKKVFFLKTRKTRKTNYLKTTIATMNNKIKKDKGNGEFFELCERLARTKFGADYSNAQCDGNSSNWLKIKMVSKFV